MLHELTYIFLYRKFLIHSSIDTKNVHTEKSCVFVTWKEIMRKLDKVEEISPTERRATTKKSWNILYDGQMK